MIILRVLGTRLLWRGSKQPGHLVLQPGQLVVLPGQHRHDVRGQGAGPGGRDREWVGLLSSGKRIVLITVTSKMLRNNRLMCSISTCSTISLTTQTMLHQNPSMVELLHLVRKAKPLSCRKGVTRTMLDYFLLLVVLN